MTTTESDHAPERALRDAGSDPVEPDGVRAQRLGSGEECRRQSAEVAASDYADRDLIDLLDLLLKTWDRE